MKKIAVLIFVIAIACGVLTGCMFGNRTTFDTTFTFTRGIVYAPDGTKVAEGPIESWRDYDDSDQLQVKIEGKTYLTAAENVIMIAD